MKRFDGAEPYLLERVIGGLWVRHADLQAWALRHKATVEKLPHSHGCHVYAADKAKRKCNCPRGDALREIEELL